MAGTATPIFPQLVKNFQAQVLPADTTTLKTLVTGGTNGTIVEALNMTSTDGTARDIQFWLTISSVAYLLCTISAPANSGNTNNTPSISVLNNTQFLGLSYDSRGNKYLYVSSGAVLSIASLVTVTAAKVVAVVGLGGDY